jgi:hypothetical protein
MKVIKNIRSIEIFLDRLSVIEQLTQDYNLIVKPHPNIFNPDRQLRSEHCRSLVSVAEYPISPNWECDALLQRKKQPVIM